MSGQLHGMVAMFATPETFLAALRRMRESGYASVEVNVPFALEGMDQWLPGKPTPMARIVLVAGILGASGGFYLQWFATRDYALNVGGRPVFSWPAFVPVTFELTVLTAALAGVGALLWLIRLPRLDHPLFALPEFGRATQDRYFLCVRADDPRFNRERIREILESLQPELVAEVDA